MEGIRTSLEEVWFNPLDSREVHWFGQAGVGLGMLGNIIGHPLELQVGEWAISGMSAQSKSLCQCGQEAFRALGHAGELVSMSSGGLKKGYFQAKATKSKNDHAVGLSLCRLYQILSQALHQHPAHTCSGPPAPSTEKA